VSAEAAGDAMDAVLAALDAAVPEAVRGVCRRLRQAGHEAVCVGGAVRDALLGRPAGDWDVATSATPAEVQELFRKTIPTGLQHGTVTVMERARPDSREGGERMAIEVTTFRGDGAYSDGRHPDSVTFGVPLREDLARRDFVINAMAYDPVDQVLVDPFGGQEDLAARRVRAVGEARVRFDEDGLRVMRAVRFAAKLDFTLDAGTEAAIPGALPRLAQVSRERVHDELVEILAATGRTRGLEIARRTGILAQILPELGPVVENAAPAGENAALAGENAAPAGENTVLEPAATPGAVAGATIAEAWQAALARVDAIADPDPELRLAALVWDVDARAVDQALRRLKASNAERARVVGLVTHGPAWQPAADTDAGLRRLLGRAGRDRAGDLVALWQAEARARPALAARLGDVAGRARRIIEAGDALTVADLALTGGDLMRLLGIGPGPVIGRLLEALLARVLAEPALNQPEALRALAPAVHAALVEGGPGSASGSRSGPAGDA
jgi:tRNA nucleotidyltransferase (CCA-adding enzyme)